MNMFNVAKLNVTSVIRFLFIVSIIVPMLVLWWAVLGGVPTPFQIKVSTICFLLGVGGSCLSWWVV